MPTLRDTTELVPSPSKQGAQQEPKGSDDPGGTKGSVLEAAQLLLWKALSPKLGFPAPSTP